MYIINNINNKYWNMPINYESEFIIYSDIINY